MENAVNKRIVFDGVGTAATAVIREFARSSSDWGKHRRPSGWWTTNSGSRNTQHAD